MESNSKPKFNHNIASVVIAAIAVALSQFPPLYTYILDSEVKVTRIPNLFVQPSALGGAVFGLNLNMTNVGYEVANVKGIHLLIENKEGKLVEAVSANMLIEKSNKASGFPSMATQSEEMMTNFFLPPNERMIRFTSFAKTDYSIAPKMNRAFLLYSQEYGEWESEYNEAMNASFDDVSFGDLSPPDVDEYKMSERTFLAMSRLVKRQLKWWENGDFKAHIVLYTEDEVVVDSYEFTITTDTSSKLLVALKESKPRTFTGPTFEHIGFDLANFNITLTPSENGVSKKVQEHINKEEKLYEI